MQPMDEITERLIRAGLQNGHTDSRQQQVQAMQIPLLWAHTGQAVCALTTGEAQSLVWPVGSPLPGPGDELELPDLPVLVVVARRFSPAGMAMVVRLASGTGNE